MQPLPEPRLVKPYSSIFVLLLYDKKLNFSYKCFVSQRDGRPSYVLVLKSFYKHVCFGQTEYSHHCSFPYILYTNCLKQLWYKDILPAWTRKVQYPSALAFGYFIPWCTLFLLFIRRTTLSNKHVSTRKLRRIVSILPRCPKQICFVLSRLTSRHVISSRRLNTSFEVFTNTRFWSQLKYFS